MQEPSRGIMDGHSCLAFTWKLLYACKRRRVACDGSVAHERKRLKIVPCSFCTNGRDTEGQASGPAWTIKNIERSYLQNALS